MIKTLISASLLTSALYAQVPDAAEAQPQPRPEVNYALSAGAAYQFDTDLDLGNGLAEESEFSMARYGASVSMAYPIRDTRLSIAHALVYEYDDYSFDGAAMIQDFVTVPAFAVIDEPWSDTHVLSYSARLTYELNRDWSLFGGPIVGIAAESGADLGDSFTYGGLAGVSYNVSPDFTIGLGVIAVKQIEESTDVLPLILFNYNVTEDLSIRNARPMPGIRGTAGLEAVWRFTPEWSAGAGFAFDRRRFRLDEDGNYPDFVGENSSYPIYARLDYLPNDHWSVGLIAGILVNGELRLEDPSGHEIAESDYDPAPFIGATTSYRF